MTTQTQEILSESSQIDEKLSKFDEHSEHQNSEIGTDFNFKREIVWFNAIGLTVMHLLAVYAFYLLFTLKHPPNLWKTILFEYCLGMATGYGITMGAHRMYSHRGFKAKTWFKVLLLWLHTVAGQNCLYVWVREHRQHHKFSDTDADPHNARRGFFFSHIGWLMSRKHPKIIEYGKKLDMSDLEADPWVMFQKKYYTPLYIVFSLLMPIAIPVYFWNETIFYSILGYFTRYVISLNITWMVNSAAHAWGTRPYDNSILPVQCKWTAWFTVGEGWHNYHHAFPWDYRASELGTPFNSTATIIDALAFFGVIYDRRSASGKMVEHRVAKTGDGTYKQFKMFVQSVNHPFSTLYSKFFGSKPETIEKVNDNNDSNNNLEDFGTETNKAD